VDEAIYEFTYVSNYEDFSALLEMIIGILMSLRPKCNAAEMAINELAQDSNIDFLSFTLIKRFLGFTRNDKPVRNDKYGE